jgi:hypothetical protein
MWPTFDQLSYFNHELDFQRPLEELSRASFLRLTPREQTSELDYGHFEAGRFEHERACKKLRTTTSKRAGSVELGSFTNHEGTGRLANESNPRIMDAGGYTETWD